MCRKLFKTQRPPYMSTTTIIETHSMETEREEKKGQWRRGFYKGQTVPLTRMLPSATMD